MFQKCYIQVMLMLKKSYQPIFPVRYDLVRSSIGLANIVSVSPYSTSSPRYMNIDFEDIRLACPILWKRAGDAGILMQRLILLFQISAAKVSGECFMDVSKRIRKH